MSIDCVAIGDEIAQNVGTALQCEQRTASGISSSKTIELAGGVYHAYCIVSVGNYDPTNSKLARNMHSIRNRTNCKTYVWLIPADRAAAITERFDLFSYPADEAVSVIAGSDGIHPSNYNVLVNSVNSVIGN